MNRINALTHHRRMSTWAKVLNVLLYPLLIPVYSVVALIFCILPFHWAVRYLPAIFWLLLVVFALPLLVGILLKRFHIVSELWSVRDVFQRRLLMSIYVIILLPLQMILGSFNIISFTILITMCVMVGICLMDIFVVTNSHIVALAASATYFYSYILSHDTQHFYSFEGIVIAFLSIVLLVGIMSYVLIEANKMKAKQFLPSILLGITTTTICILLQR